MLPPGNSSWGAPSIILALFTLFLLFAHCRASSEISHTSLSASSLSGTESSSLAVPTTSAATVPSNQTRPAPDAADELVLKALAVLRLRNKARVEHPAVNKYELANASELVANATSAAELDVDDVDLETISSLASSISSAAAESGSPSNKRRTSRSTDEEDDEEMSSPYSISPELALAAAQLAEKNLQLPQGNHSAVAAQMREKYRHRMVNDTNMPPQKDRPHGRLGAFGAKDQAVLAAQQSSGGTY